jgi:hypothetical protein
MTLLLCKLNDTGVAMDESLTVESETDAAVSAAALVASAAAVAVVTAAEIAAATLQPPPPVIYTTCTRPPPFEMVELDLDAFKVVDKNGKLRSDAAARIGKCRAVNEFVNTILGNYFSEKYTPQQLVLALRLSSQHPNVRMLFKSASLTDVEDLDAM